MTVDRQSRDPFTNKLPERQGDKGEVAHVEDVGDSKTPDLAPAGLIDENLVRAENEDKITPYFVFLISIAAVAGFLFGYDTGVIGSVTSMIGTDLGHTLSNSETEIITAGTTIGAIFGASVLGSMADKLGRKWSMAIADAFFTMGSIILASSFSVAQAVMGRLILGVGVGGAAVIGPLYITELAPTAVRGRCIGVNAFFIPFGQVIASALGAIFEAFVPYHIGWRVLCAFGVVPSIVQLALMHWLPESPRVLILRGQVDQARDTFKVIYRGASEEIIDLKLTVAMHYVEATTRLQREYSLKQRTLMYWTHKPYRRAIMAVSGVQIFAQLTGFNTLLYYSGRIFGLLGLSNAAAASLIPSGSNALFVLIGVNIVDRVGRRRLLVTSIPVMTAGLLWCLVSFYFLAKPTGGDLLADYGGYSQGLVGSVLAAILVFTCAYGIGYSHIGWYQSEFLALEIRAVGSSCSTVACWLANLIVSTAYLTQLESLKPYGTYALYAGFCIIGYVFVFTCYPETKGLSIDETGVVFSDDFGVKKSERMRKEKIEMSRRLREEAMPNLAA